MDARRILHLRSSGSRAKRTPCPCNKPSLAASVLSPHHRSHQPASTLPSAQGLGHSIYQLTPGPSRRHSFTTSITYGANPGTEGCFLYPSPPALNSSLLIYLENFPRVNTTGYQAERLHNIVCHASDSSKNAIFERLSRYLRVVFSPTATDAQASQTQRIRHDADTGAPTTCDLSRTSWEMSRMPTSHLEPRWRLTGQQYSHSRQLSPCLNAYNTPSRTPLRARSKKRRSEQRDPPWPFHQGPTHSRLVSFEPSPWESSSRSSTSSSGARICPNT